MRYRARFLAYAIWVHKNAVSKNWLMQVKVLSNTEYQTYQLQKFSKKFKTLDQVITWFRKPQLINPTHSDLITLACGLGN